jgi:uncharacterized membrane protein YcaP (DUF421 family)
MIELYPYLIIALKSISIYVFIIVAIRLFGKKELSQLSIIDLVFILLISNSVQNAMVGNDTSVQGGMAAALGLFLCNYIFRFFLMKSKKFNTAMQGEAIVLALNGKLLQDGLKRAGMNEKELEMIIREHGIEDIKNADLIVLEIDGNVSVVSSDFSKRSIKRRKKPQLMRNP